MKKLTVLLLLTLFSLAVFAEKDPAAKKKPRRKDALNVYIEASGYLKEEVPYINYVRDIQDADIAVLSTYQKTGSGGGEYTFFVQGRNKFAGVMDTVMFYTYPDETDLQIMQKGANIFKMGLMRYIIETPLADFIDIEFTEPIEEEVSTDKWNNWVFATSIGGSLQGQESGDASTLKTSFTAGKTSNNWRLNAGINYNTSKTVYKYVDFTDIREDGRVYGDAVKSIGEHWAVGMSSDVFTSIYSNYDLGFVVGPAIEYDIFPYSESTRRIFRFNYVLNYGYNDYADTTVFLKTEESLWSQRLESSYTNFQQWGTVSVTAGYSNYLHDFSLNRVSIGAYASIKIAKGLSFTMQAGYQFIHDQISLRKGDVSIEDVYLQRRELSTTYSYRTTVGITYRFGSIYNNVVNRRLDVLF
jgi:hypothetical protein